jgi:hypothetical protein
VLAPLAWVRSCSDLQLAGASVVLGVGWLASFVIVDDPWPLVHVLRVVFGAVAAPLLAIVAGLRMLTPALRPPNWAGSWLLATSAVAVIALALTADSFAVGFDDAEANRPFGLFAALTTVFALTSVAGFAAALGLVFFVLLRRRSSLRASVAVAIPLGVLAAPLVAATLLVPGTVVAFSLVVLGYALAPRLARAFRLPAAARPLAAVEPVRGRVVSLAAASLAITLIVATAGIATSIAASGTDAATVGLGVAGTVGQLAVIPLLWALGLVLEFWLPRVSGAVRAGFAVASATVLGSVIAMLVGYSPQGDRYVQLLAVLSLGVGVWAASVVWGLYPAFSMPARIAAAAATALLAGCGYFGFAAVTAGIVLALASGFLAFGGARLLLRQSPPPGAPG